jgi:hypothetical protein
MKIEVARSYDRKIKFGDTYEMAGIFASYKQEIDGTEKDAIKRSEELFQMAKKDVELQVDILQNPGKVIRGYTSITEMRQLIKNLQAEVEELKKEKSKALPF